MQSRPRQQTGKGLTSSSNNAGVGAGGRSRVSVIESALAALANTNAFSCSTRWLSVCAVARPDHESPEMRQRPIECENRCNVGWDSTG